MELGIGAIAQQIRLHQNLSITDFAKELGVGKSYISKLESGMITHQPSRNFIKKFAEKYGLDEVDLLLRTGRLPVGMEQEIARKMLKERQSLTEAKEWEVFVNRVPVGKWSEVTTKFQFLTEDEPSFSFRDRAQLINNMGNFFKTDDIELKPIGKSKNEWGYNTETREPAPGG